LKLNKTSSIHPFLFAVFPVIFLVSYNADLLLPQEIVIPSLVILFAAFVLWISIGKVLKNKKKSAFIVSSGLVLFFSYGHIYNLVQGQEIGNFLFGRTLVLFPIFFIMFIIGIIYFIKTKRKLDNATTIVNVIAISLVIVSSVNIITYNFETDRSLNIIKVDSELETITSNTEKLPNIYYIILDAYARDDVLKEKLDFDNHEFISYLTNKGFYVAPNSHSNYAKTSLSLASSLNMKYVSYSPEEEISKDNTSYTTLISNNKVMQYLKSRGYVTINISSGWNLTENLDVANVNLCFSDKYVDSELLIMLVRTTMLKPVSPDLFDKGQRETILCSFSELSKVHQNFEEPVFVFAHFLIPHPPYVFGSNGESVDSEVFDFDVWDEKGYLDQVKFSNKKITEFIEAILSDNSNPPIIIIQGDHGSGFSVDLYNLTKNMMKERAPILNAYYFPENPESLIYENITPVNSFRIIFNSYFDEEFEILDDRIYMHQINKNTYEFEDVTDYIMNTSISD